MTPERQTHAKVSSGRQERNQVSPEEHGDTRVDGEQSKDDWSRTDDAQDVDFDIWIQSICQDDPSHPLNNTNVIQPTVEQEDVVLEEVPESGIPSTTPCREDGLSNQGGRTTAQSGGRWRHLWGRCIHYRVSTKTVYTFVYWISRLPTGLEIPSWTFFNSPFCLDFRNI